MSFNTCWISLQSTKCFWQDFFLQVVGVFREYTTDQINALEGKMKENQIQLETLQRCLKSVQVQHKADLGVNKLEI